MAAPRSADGSQLPMSERSATKSQLAAASRAASGVKLRVSGGLFQLGWLMVVLGAAGTFRTTHAGTFRFDEEGARSRLSTAADGGWSVWATVMLMGLPTMALAARCDMVIVIRVMSVVAFVCFLLLFLGYTFTSVVGTATAGRTTGWCAASSASWRRGRRRGAGRRCCSSRCRRTTRRSPATASMTTRWATRGRGRARS